MAAKYRVRRYKDWDSFHRRYDEYYVIDKKHWYGWSVECRTDDINEVVDMVNNLSKFAYVYQHWTLLQRDIDKIFLREYDEQE